MTRRRQAAVSLGIVALLGCSSSLQPPPQQGTGGAPATGGSGSGGVPATGGASGSGGGQPAPCGATICTSGEFCCDRLCSVCAPIGSLCDLGCPIDAGAAGACASLAAQYEQAVAAAQACTVGSSGGCGAIIHASLATSNCGCDFIYVNDDTQTKAIYQTWLSLGCEPKSLCVQATCGALPGPSGFCASADGGAAGICQILAPGQS